MRNNQTMTNLANRDAPKMQGKLYSLELNRVFVVFAGLLVFLLASVTFLGVKQYFLFTHCREVATLSDQILFGFTSIKEYISETLLTGEKVDLAEVSGEMERLNKEVKQIRDDQLIPEALKAPFLSNINLLGLVVELRGVQGDSSHTAGENRHFFASLRSTSELLQQFNGSLVSHTQSLLLGLHRVLVGTLAIVVFAVCGMMFFMHRCIAEPVIRLQQTICRIIKSDGCQPGRPEVKAAVTSLTSHIVAYANTRQRLENSVRCLENIRKTLPKDINAPDYWETLCLALESNPDYLLVWIGHPEGNELSRQSVTGCGCVSSAPPACQETIKHMLNYCSIDGSLCATARQAIASKKVVVDLTSAVDLPEGLQASLPFAGDRLYCASFPVIHNRSVTAVVTMYSAFAESFSKIVLPLLEFFFSCLAPGNAGLSTDNSSLYSHAVLGVLAAGRVHEITDAVNGALNYSQALLDLTDNGALDENERYLLKKLHQEARKSASLSHDLSLLSGNHGSLPDKMPLSLLLEQVIALLAADLKKKGIRVDVRQEKDIPPLVVPVDHLLLVLLTLLWRSALYLADSATHNQEKVIQVFLAEDEVKKQLTLTIVGCPGDATFLVNKPANTPWPDLSTCAQLLAKSNATLVASSDNTSAKLPQLIVAFSRNK